MQKNILKEIRRSGFSLERLAEGYPEFSVLKNVPQNPAYHAEGDVYTHTLMVCERLVELPEWQGLAQQEQEMAFLAAAFHDIGKPACTKWENGAWTSPKHTIVGEKKFRQMVYRASEQFGLTFAERELAAGLVRYHGLPVWFWKKRRPEFELLKAAERVPLRLLYVVSKADALGRAGTEENRLPEYVELFADYAKELGIWENPYPFAGPYARYQYFHKEDMWQGAELFDDTEFDVVLMSGLPLSGKDTWIGCHGGHRDVISLDDIREESGIRPGGGSAKVVDIAIKRARVLLRRKEPFIWNATNIVRETRQKLTGLFSGYGARVHVCYLEAPYRELLGRNKKRERQIPEAVLEKMIDKLEVPAPWEAYETDWLAGAADCGG